MKKSHRRSGATTFPDPALLFTAMDSERYEGPASSTPPFYKPLPSTMTAHAPRVRQRRPRSGWIPVVVTLTLVLVLGGPPMVLFALGVSKESAEQAVRGFYDAYNSRDRDAALAATCGIEHDVISNVGGAYTDDPIQQWFNPPPQQPSPDPEDDSGPGLGINDDLLRSQTSLDIVQRVNPSIDHSEIKGVGNIFVWLNASEIGDPHLMVVHRDGGEWKVCNIKTYYPRSSAAPR